MLRLRRVFLACFELTLHYTVIGRLQPFGVLNGLLLSTVCHATYSVISSSLFTVLTCCVKHFPVGADPCKKNKKHAALLKEKLSSTGPSWASRIIVSILSFCSWILPGYSCCLLWSCNMISLSSSQRMEITI